MADSASDREMESDTSSIDGMPSGRTGPESVVKRVESLAQENRVLRMEIETLKLRNKALQQENKELKQASVNIQAKAEQEEEYISNTLLKKIQALKKEKEMLAMNYEHEEEFLTNDLTRQLHQLRNEKATLEKHLEAEQQAQVNKLLKRIDRLENEIKQKQITLEQLKREKVELENSLEQEQEALVNKLWKKMDKLEVEKRMLQERLDQPVSEPASPRLSDSRDVGKLTQNIVHLREEVAKYRDRLSQTQLENAEKMAALIEEERQVKQENLRLQRKLQLEVERREALHRHLSESESSLEMDDERHFNEFTKQQDGYSSASSSRDSFGRSRTISSPTPYQSAPNPSRTPPHGGAVSPPNPLRCNSCGQIYHPSSHHPPLTPPSSALSSSVPSVSPSLHSQASGGGPMITSSTTHGVIIPSHQPITSQRSGPKQDGKFIKPPLPSRSPH